DEDPETSWILLN
nr:Chain C, Ectopic P granules protein 5 homolog [Homo sapiens]7JHX_D Chain D, Ectopic P granules protein 5 homolog [Homo sapiens]